MAILNQNRTASLIPDTTVGFHGDAVTSFGGAGRMPRSFRNITLQRTCFRPVAMKSKTRRRRKTQIWGSDPE